MTTSSSPRAPGPVPIGPDGEPTVGAFVHDLTQQFAEQAAAPSVPERAIEGVKEDLAAVKGARR